MWHTGTHTHISLRGKPNCEGVSALLSLPTQEHRASPCTVISGFVYWALQSATVQDHPWGFRFIVPLEGAVISSGVFKLPFQFCVLTGDASDF